MIMVEVQESLGAHLPLFCSILFYSILFYSISQIHKTSCNRQYMG